MSTGRFEIGPALAAVEEQAARAGASGKADWSRLFYGHFCLKFDGQDYGGTEHALGLTYRILEALSSLVFRGKDRAFIEFVESVHCVGFRIEDRGEALIVSHADRSDRVFSAPDAVSGPIPLREFATAVHQCHLELCDQAVRMYPGQFTRANHSAIPYSDHLI